MVKELSERMQFLYDMVALFVKKQYTKKTNAKYAVKADISMKTKSFNDSAKRSAFSAG